MIFIGVKSCKITLCKGRNSTFLRKFYWKIVNTLTYRYTVMQSTHCKKSRNVKKNRLFAKSIQIHFSDLSKIERTMVALQTVSPLYSNRFCKDQSTLHLVVPKSSFKYLCLKVNHFHPCLGLIWVSNILGYVNSSKKLILM